MLASFLELDSASEQRTLGPCPTRRKTPQSLIASPQLSVRAFCLLQNDAMTTCMPSKFPKSICHPFVYVVSRDVVGPRTSSVSQLLCLGARSSHVRGVDKVSVQGRGPREASVFAERRAGVRCHLSDIDPESIIRAMVLRCPRGDRSVGHIRSEPGDMLCGQGIEGTADTFSGYNESLTR
jgi:hypothetical protein